MNIYVCVKQVPDTEARVKVGADGKSIDSADSNTILNPFDEFAVEQALLAREQHGGEVTALSLGDEGSAAVIRTAMAMGADKGIHLKTGQSADDPLQVGKALAREIGGSSVDLVFFGRQAVGNENGQVGLIVAELLAVPAISEVSSLELSSDSASGKREIEGGSESFATPLPAVFTTQKGLNEPRYPSLKGRMAAKKKPIEVREVTLDEPLLTVEKINYPPERSRGVIVGEGAAAVPELVRLLKEEAKVL